MYGDVALKCTVQQEYQLRCALGAAKSGTFSLYFENESFREKVIIWGFHYKWLGYVKILKLKFHN